MESVTYQKNLKVSPKKLRMIRNNIFKMSPKEALDYLLYAPTKPAKTYYKVLNSAIQNAVNSLKVQADMLQFKLLTIEEGRKLSRFKAGSKGMAKPIVRRYSHIKVVLVEKAQPKKAEKKAEQKEVKKEKAEKKPLAKKETVKKEKKAAEVKNSGESTKEVTK
ncbi:hypothetical protein IPM65_07560 [Candidatus Roizmanbacteria bacterium]|nr:MAG: hypothetical protein IPM65_07560 [Candidatus Roizmanbacteria bacterium]